MTSAFSSFNFGSFVKSLPVLHNLLRLETVQREARSTFRTESHSHRHDCALTNDCGSQMLDEHLLRDVRRREIHYHALVWKHRRPGLNSMQQQLLQFLLDPSVREGNVDITRPRNRHSLHEECWPPTPVQQQSHSGTEHRPVLQS